MARLPVIAGIFLALKRYDIIRGVIIISLERSCDIPTFTKQLEPIYSSVPYHDLVTGSVTCFHNHQVNTYYDLVLKLIISDI